MNRRFLTIGPLLAVFLVAHTLTAQESVETADQEQTPAQQVTELIKQKKLDQAQQVLEAALAEAPNDAKLRAAQLRLAQRYLLKRKYPTAFTLLNETLEHQLDNIDEPINQAMIVSTISYLRSVGTRLGKVDDVKVSLDRAIGSLDANPLGATTIRSLSVLLINKAQALAGDDLDAAIAFLQSRISKLDQTKAKGKEREAVLVSRSRLSFAAAMLPGAPKTLLDEADEYVQQLLQDNPESLAVLREFGSSQLLYVRKVYRSEPGTAEKRIASASDVLSKAPKKYQSVLRTYVSSMKALRPRIEAAIKLQRMIGNAAPKFQIDAWVNQGEVTEETLEGKVVLVDFWSVWCGPCMATFPHLRQWYDEFHDQGFEIVGVTRYYNYEWNDAAKRAVLSAEPVEPDVEQEMLSQFLQHHNLRHPTIVTPQDSTMQKKYGVTGIPHAVLLDRKGSIRMVKVGSSPDNAAELHAKIKELLAE